MWQMRGSEKGRGLGILWIPGVTGVRGLEV